MHTYIELEKKLFYNKRKGMYPSLPEKVRLIRLLFKFYLTYIGEFGFEDFVTVLAFRMRQADLEEDLQKAFKIFDRDGDGYITVKELRYLMTNLGERYTEEEVTEMIREVDLDCKGKVDFHGNNTTSSGDLDNQCIKALVLSICFNFCSMKLLYWKVESSLDIHI